MDDPNRLRSSTNDDGEDEVDEEMECIAYFWMGRDASKMGWLNFNFRYGMVWRLLLYFSYVGQLRK